MTTQSRQVLFSLAGFCLIASCGDTEDPATTPAPVALRWTVDESKGKVESVLSDQVGKSFLSGDMFPGVGKIPIVGGFYKGKHVDYWFFPAFMKGGVRETPETAPIYHFVKKENARDPRAKGIGKPVINAIPGDKDYSPFWEIINVIVPDGYNADDVKSEDSILKAQEDGVFELVPMGKAVNCPVVKAGTDIEDNYPESSRFHVNTVTYWYKGIEVTALDFTESDGLFDAKGDPKFEGANTIIAAPGYVPHRTEKVWDPACKAPASSDGCMKLDMPVPTFEVMLSMMMGAKMDLNGDGDTKDGSNIFDVVQGDKEYSPMWEIHPIMVPATVDLFDTKANPALPADEIQMESRYRSLDDLKTVYSKEELDAVAKFPPDPAKGNHYVNCPVKRAENLNNLN